jgi:hypothetical protein
MIDSQTVFDEYYFFARSKVKVFSKKYSSHKVSESKVNKVQNIV